MADAPYTPGGMSEPPRLLQVRSLPADAYETLRRLAFERKQTYAEVIAWALAVASTPGAQSHWATTERDNQRVKQ